MRGSTTFLTLAGLLSAQAPLTVQTTEPAGYGKLGVFDPVTVTFAQPVDPATVSEQSFTLFGSWTGVVSGTVHLDPTHTVATFQPKLPLLLGDFVRVDLHNTIQAANGGVLTGGYHFELSVASNPGSGNFQQTGTIDFRMPGENPIGTYGIHAGDVDRDGVADVTAINEISHDIRVFKSDGCGAVGPMTLISDGYNWPSPHDSADFNGDGWMDLVTGDYIAGNISIFMNDGAGNYLPPVGLAGNAFIRSIAAADLNGDGAYDLAAGNGLSTLVWINDGAGNFLPSTGYGQPGAEINVVDVNGDGWWDIAGCSISPAQVHVLLGQGDGTFAPAGPPVVIGGNPWATCAADINNDGNVDLGFAALYPMRFTWLHGDGTGAFTVGGQIPAGSWPTSLHFADLEGDGDMDAVTSHYTSADFYIYWNDGTGNYGAPTILPAVGGGACATIVDLDRDGDLDILGADEGIDIGILYTQDGPAPLATLQQPSCDAALRINQRAAGAGYAARAPVPVVAGSSMAVSLSGAPNAFGVLAMGAPSATPTTLPTLGLLNLDVTFTPYVMTITTLDAHGELVYEQPLPAAAPVGASLAVQGLVLSTSAEVLSNPVRFEIVP